MCNNKLSRYNGIFPCYEKIFSCSGGNIFDIDIFTAYIQVILWVIASTLSRRYNKIVSHFHACVEMTYFHVTFSHFIDIFKIFSSQAIFLP